MKINISENLYNLRKQNKYTLEYVSEIMDVSRQTVAKWESGETYPDIKNCVKLSMLYKISIDALVKGVVEKTNEDITQKFVCDITKLSKNGEIKLPQKVIDIFGFKTDDTLLVLCDSKQGIALVKCDGE